LTTYNKYIALKNRTSGTVQITIHVKVKLWILGKYITDREFLGINLH
jgi:hypothetical protein